MLPTDKLAVRLASVMLLAVLVPFRGDAVAQTRGGGSELLYGETSEPRNYNPYQVDFRSGELDRFLSMVYEPLFRYNHMLEEWEPVLAVSVSEPREAPGPEPTWEIEITLKETAGWHDGNGMTPQDVVFTYKYLSTQTKNEEVRSFYGSHLLSVRRAGPSKVAMRFRRRPPEIHAFLDAWILPSHYFDDDLSPRIDVEPLSQHPIGTGPFRFVMPERLSDSPKLERFEDYHGGADAQIGAVVLWAQPDPTQAVNLIQVPSPRGIDLLVDVLPTEIEQLEAVENVQVGHLQTFNIWAVAIRPEEGSPLAIPAVRRALTMAVNRQSLLESYFRAGQLVASPVVGTAPYHNPAVEPLPNNAVAARDTLARFAPNGLGTLRLIYPRSVDPREDRIQNAATWIKNDLGDIGVTVETVPLEQNEFTQRLYTGQGYDLALVQWEFDPIYDISQIFHSDYATAGGKNVMRYENEHVDRYLDDYLNAADPNARRTNMYSLQETLRDDAPAIFLFTVDMGYAHKNWLVIPPQAQDPFYFFTYITAWLVATI